jgi:TolA-binding protein
MHRRLLMMKRTLLGAAVAATLIIPPTAATADSTDMADVKRMIEQMKADYEQRIQQLEQRLEQAEANTGNGPKGCTATQRHRTQTGQGPGCDHLR